MTHVTKFFFTLFILPYTSHAMLRTDNKERGRKGKKADGRGSGLKPKFLALIDFSPEGSKARLNNGIQRTGKILIFYWKIQTLEFVFEAICNFSIKIEIENRKSIIWCWLKVLIWLIFQKELNLNGTFLTAGPVLV